MGDHVRPAHAPALARARPSITARRTSACTAGVAHHTLLTDTAFPGFELRLNQSYDLAVRRRAARATCGSTFASPMNDTSTTARSNGRADAAAASAVADVRALEHAHARVVPQRPCELAVADVDRRHRRARRAAAGSR